MCQLKGYCFNDHGNRAELNDENIKKITKKCYTQKKGFSNLI